MWLEPAEWLGGERAKDFPRHLISHQPKTRLHSQLDCGATSVANKIGGREPVLIHPDDAAARGISDGDVVRLFNDRGACLAGARVTPDVRPGVLVLPTGAWYDPEKPGGLDRHGNPNVLTLDKGTSRLAQGPSAHTTLVEVEKITGLVPEVRAFDPPVIVWREPTTPRGLGPALESPSYPLWPSLPAARSFDLGPVGRRVRGTPHGRSALR